MKITPKMTAESGGALLDLADYQDDDGTGVKVTASDGRVRVKVDSYDPFGDTIYLAPADALGLASRLCEVAAGLPADDWTASDDGAALLAAWARCAAAVAAAVAGAGDVHDLTVAAHMAAQDLQGAAREVLDRQRRGRDWGWLRGTAGESPGPVPSSAAEADAEAWGGRGPSASHAEWRAEGQAGADDDPPEAAEYDPGPEVDDEGGMSEHRHAPHEPEPWT